MARLNLYIDDETRRRIEAVARCAGISISSWVRRRLTSALETEWPDGYFECCGALGDVRLIRPEPLPPDDDVSRDPL